MTETYVVADLHGRFDLLEMALAKIEANQPGTVIFTGDYVDRGPQSREIIERLISGPTIAGWKWICLKGNHEDIMRQACGNPAKISWWLDNGGGETLLSYGHPPRGGVDTGFVPKAHIDWIKSLPLYYFDRHRIYVHAGVNPANRERLSDRSEDELIWFRYRNGDERGAGGFHVVHGHHQFEDGPKLYSGRTDLDTGAFHTGRLVVGVFDDCISGGPVSLIDCRLASAPRQFSLRRSRIPQGEPRSLCYGAFLRCITGWESR